MIIDPAYMGISRDSMQPPELSCGIPGKLPRSGDAEIRELLITAPSCAGRLGKDARVVVVGDHLIYNAIELARTSGMVAGSDIILS